MAMDGITPDDHPLYLSLYVAALVLGHVAGHSALHPSNPSGRLSGGEVAVNRHRYANKAVSGVHAAVLSVVSVRCYLTRGYDLGADRLLDLPPLEHLAVGFMIAYLLYDTAFLLWRYHSLQPRLGVREAWSTSDHTLALAHHVLGLASWSLIHSGLGGIYWAQLVHLAELSTPLLNLRWILMKEGRRAGPAYLALSAAFLSTFFWCRIPPTSLLLWAMWRGLDRWPSPTVGRFHLAVTFGFWCINLAWFGGGMRMALRALGGGGGKGRKGKTR